MSVWCTSRYKLGHTHYETKYCHQCLSNGTAVGNCANQRENALCQLGGLPFLDHVGPDNLPLACSRDYEINNKYFARLVDNKQIQDLKYWFSRKHFRALTESE